MISRMALLAATLVAASATLFAQEYEALDRPVVEIDDSGIASWVADTRTDTCIVRVDTGSGPDELNAPVIPVKPANKSGAPLTFDTSVLSAGDRMDVICQQSANVGIRSRPSAAVIIESGVPDTPDFIPTQTLLSDGTDTSTWERYRSGGDGGIISTETGALHFQGNGGDAWSLEVGVAAQCVAADVQAVDDSDFTLLFKTLAGSGPRNVRFSTDGTLPVYGNAIALTLDSSYKDGTANNLQMPIEALLAAEGDTLVSIVSINVVSTTSLRIDNLVTTDECGSFNRQASISIDEITGDGVLIPSEESAGIMITGKTVAVADNATITVSANGTEYPATVTNGTWSVSIDSSTLGGWSDTTTVVATIDSIENDGTDLGKAEADLTRYSDLPSAGGGAGDITDPLANYGPRGLLDPGGVKARPNAVGHGANVVGGRGGTLVVVDSVSCAVNANDGVTTFREAWEGSGGVTSGKRTIVFSVSGVTVCPADELLKMRGGNITILGQTAPFPGFHVATLKAEVKHVSEVNIQHLGFLGRDPSGKANPSGPGDSEPLASSGRGLAISGSSQDTHDIYFGNVYNINYTDDASSFSGNGTTGRIFNVSYQDAVVGEGDASSSHYESWAVMDPNHPSYAFRKRTYYHSMGMGFLGPDNRTFNVSLIGTLTTDAGFRNPVARGIDRFEFIGNAGYNCVDKGFDFWAGPSNGFVFDNIAKRGPNSRNNCWQIAGTRINVYRNKLVTRDGVSVSAPEKTAQSDLPINNSPTIRRYKFDERCIGPVHRDANIQRIVDEYVNGTGEVGIGPPFGDPLVADGDGGRHWDPAEGGSLSVLPVNTHPAGHDTDNDGMADAWEVSAGLNVGVKDHNVVHADGYTMIEKYAAFAARPAVVCPQPTS